jgi:hypothetical protein
MKAIIILSIITFGYLNLGRCQTKIDVKMPLLKEGHVIDAFLDTLFKIRPVSDSTNNKVLIGILKDPRDTSLFFTIISDDNQQVDCTISDIKNGKRDDFGYINYSRYTVFFRMKETSGLFKETSKSKSFEITNSSTCDSVPLIKALYLYDIIYKNGQIYIKPMIGQN